ncbi:hypothetical protein EW145_g1845 [Phellinidium pouzarii]|uniref:Uncharacterized protein n=1 Tax=Phellinidium pouzarii TaxID=167371 RepID=A0A4S4LEU8_9AGAM|nr:hypothetical protein EW145_g1845 [Phellinidium pouzarii]
MDRTARWVQMHAQPGYHQQSSLSSRNRTQLDRKDGMSSQQSSRTDLGGQDHGVGSGGRARARQSSTVLAVAGSSRSSQRIIPADAPLFPPGHHRSHSHSNSLPREHPMQPRLNIPPSLYRNPNLPAFVQGPPGSGYPMSMSSAHPMLHQTVRAAVPSPPSPPIQIPAPLNPKKSRPIVHKRRPSLSGATFDPPLDRYSSSFHRGPENREPRAQGPGDGHHVRIRAASETRRSLR